LKVAWKAKYSKNMNFGPFSLKKNQRRQEALEMSVL
jgi:hypothetical protein